MKTRNPYAGALASRTFRQRVRPSKKWVPDIEEYEDDMDGLDNLVDKYIKFRDIKAKLKAKHSNELEPVETALKTIEATLLSKFAEIGTESVRTTAGTAFKSTRTSATVVDWDQVLDYVKANGAWELLERRVNKSAVEEFREANDDLPPGVNMRSEITINVRRS